jgi:NodT family efflux transporter outer membrane factor (OMF) lipoprotein
MAREWPLALRIDSRTYGTHTFMNTFKRSATASLAVALILLSGCMVGPKYHTPTADTPAAYKELPAADAPGADVFKVAQPKDDQLRGKWWEIFNDQQLNALEEKVNVSNQNIASAAASFFAARAMVKEARAQLFPTVTVNPAITVQRPSASTSTAQTTGTGTGGTGTGGTGTGGTGTGSTSQTATATFRNYTLPFDATWQPDLFGRVRNTVRAAAYGAQSSAADLENTRLTLQAELAEDYFQLRGQDALKQLLDSTVDADQKALDLTKSLFDTGIDSEESVAQADTQLKSAQAEDTALGIQRAELEHAIAMLTGQPASTFSLAYQPLTATPPPIPVSVPSELLERRPDIASAERLVAQANAQIGIARAAYFPTVTLTAGAGFESNAFATWFSWPSRFFSLGSAAAETLFDAGLRHATVEQFKAQYDETVANYRQAVLTGFQQVEDNLAALRILSIEIQQQDAAVKAADRTLTIATDRYKLGLDPYLNVITAQTALFSNQQIEVNLQIQQMTASCGLVEALGGGWDSSQLPSPAALVSKAP